MRSRTRYVSVVGLADTKGYIRLVRDEMVLRARSTRFGVFVDLPSAFVASVHLPTSWLGLGELEDALVELTSALNAMRAIRHRSKNKPVSTVGGVNVHVREEYAPTIGPARVAAPQDRSGKGIHVADVAGRFGPLRRRKPGGRRR